LSYIYGVFTSPHERKSPSSDPSPKREGRVKKAPHPPTSSPEGEGVKKERGGRR